MRLRIFATVLLACTGCAISPAPGSPADAGAADGGAEQGGLTLSKPLHLDKAAVQAGDTLTGTVSWTNASSAPLAINAATLAARPPGGTHAGGPYADLSPSQGPTTLAPGQSLTLTASRSFSAADPAGTWECYPTYQDAAGAWHDGPGLTFTVGDCALTTCAKQGKDCGSIPDGCGAALSCGDTCPAGQSCGGGDVSNVCGAAAAAAALGVNIGGVNDWDPTQMFADAMKQARKFGHVDTPYDEAAPVDAHGWPTGDASVIVIEGNPGAWTAGTYALSFTGTATVTPFPARSTGVSVSNLASGGGTTTATVTLTSAHSGLWLRFTGTTGGVRDVKLMRPTKAGTPHPASAVFTDRFLDRLKYFSALRFMDYSATNGNTEQAWADRNLPANATQQRVPGYSGAQVTGAAWEYAVLLANATGKDLWLNVPHRVLGQGYALSDSTYLTNLARLLKYGSDASGTPYTSPQASPAYPPLAPGLHVYLEFSNELWNGAFGQAGWISGLADAAIAARDPDLCFDGTTDRWAVIPRLTALAALRVSDAFRAVFGDAAMMTTVRPVLAAQFANAGTYSGLSFLDARHQGSARALYAIAGAPYVDIAQESAALPVDQIFAQLSAYQANEIASWLASTRSTALAHGLKLVAYEGGQTLYPSLGNAANKLAAQTDPRMKDQTLALLRSWYAAGGDLFMYYDLCGAWGSSGYWGLAPDISYDIDADPLYPTAEAYPKWGAMKKIASGP